MLAGTMGELRSSHFHAGLDIHANVGESVHAANDGYIYRATVATGGYGTVLYVRHPDGKGTVYAHLSEFVGPIADFVLEERYKRKQSEIDLFLKPGQFPVKQGEVIARSGNTGGSGGPHLHFELRDSNEEALNPMSLNFEEVRDHTAPLPQRVALRTMDINSRVNDQFGRFEFPVTKKGSSFVVPQPVNASGQIGLEVLAYDRMENSSFRFGINLIELYANNEKIFTQKIEKISFAESRNILALVDYKTMETRGYRYNKLYVDDGNKLPFYNGTNLKNGIMIKDEDVDLEIKLIDYNGNTSSVLVTLKAAPESKNADFNENGIRPVTTEISGNVLALNVTMCDPRDESALSGGVQVYSNGRMRTLAPSYSARAHNVFLVDLNKDQPDSIVTCSGTWVSNFRDRVPSNSAYKYYSDLIDIDFPVRSLYDTLFLSTAYDSTSRETFTVGTRMTPLQQSVHIQLKPLRSYSPSKSLGVYRVDHNGYTFMNSYWKNGKVGFNSLALGQFTLLYDSVPPTARPITMSSSIVRMSIRDQLSGISYFEASINGEWLLMTYDYKTGLIYSERLDRSKPIKGEFEMKVVDNAGNETIYKKRIP
ncbi:MAG: M23 family metallopeptidase [Bacteroidota bacterium]